VYLIGGTAFILRRRQKSSNLATSFIERGYNSETHSAVELKTMEGDMRISDGVTHESEYKKASDVVNN